jgi:hypothetical protein
MFVFLLFQASWHNSRHRPFARPFGNNSPPPREQHASKNVVFPKKTAERDSENPKKCQIRPENVLEQLAECQKPRENQHLFGKRKPLAKDESGTAKTPPHLFKI